MLYHHKLFVCQYDDVHLLRQVVGFGEWKDANLSGLLRSVVPVHIVPPLNFQPLYHHI